MPTYEFKCDKCEHYFEKFLPMSAMREPEGESCPQCKELAVKKVMMTPHSLGDPVRLGITRPDDGFREVLQKIHANNPHSDLNVTSRYI